MVHLGCVEVQVGDVHAEREQAVGQDHGKWAAEHVDRVGLENQGQHECVARDQHRDHRQDQQQPPADELHRREPVTGRKPEGHGDQHARA